MKLKYLLFNYILIGLFCACTLTACGSDDPAPAPTPPEKPEQPEPEEPEYEGILTNKLIDAYYMGVGITGTAEYYIVFSNVETDDTYMPKEKGITVILDMFSTPSADAINPILPTGTYNYNENKDINTFNPQNSYILIKGDEGDAQMGVISNGTVTVAYESGIYTITADLEIMGQTTVSCRYQGAIQFIEGASNSFDRITKDLNLTFEKAEGRYFANQAYHHSDDFSLYLTTGDIDSSGEGTDGYFLLFQGYTFKIDPSSSINILDGTYIAYPYDESNSNYLPLTFKPGDIFEFMGEIFPRGSYIKHIDGATGKEEYGFIKDGTMEKDGDSYTFNLTLENNVKATLSFKGNVNLLDKRSPIVRYSTLTEDITLQLSSKLTESAAAYSENSWLENMDEWLILINNPDGDMIMIEFMTKDCNGILPEGVYTVGHTFIENEIIPGFYDTVNGALLYSWYVSNVVEVEEGVALASPINGGTLKISRKENDYTLDFDFIDDSETPPSYKRYLDRCITCA